MLVNHIESPLIILLGAFRSSLVLSVVGLSTIFTKTWNLKNLGEGLEKKTYLMSSTDNYYVNLFILVTQTGVLGY